MATHQQRLASARSTIDYICSRSPEQMTMPVPNCPGWTVYNAAVHIARVGVAWHSMINATPDDPDSRVRGYADSEARGSDHPPEVLSTWVTDAINALDDDVERRCYFSMTGGEGTVGLWGWHVASELGVHRLDVEAALGDEHALNDEMAMDSIEYMAQFFMPAMSRLTEKDPGAFEVVAQRDGEEIGRTTVRSAGETASSAATVIGEPIDILLALWGRPHGQLEITGDAEVVRGWQALPGEAFQFGTWD